MSGRPASTLGFEKRVTPMLAVDKRTFDAGLTADTPPASAGMVDIVVADLRGVSPSAAQE